MLTNARASLLFLCLLLIFSISCRHKKKAVSAKAVVKKDTGHKPAPSTTNVKPANGKGNSHADILQQKLGVSEKEINNSKLFLFIDDWYGVPYKYGGCQKTGIDCSCFTNLLCDKVYNQKIARSASDMYKECRKVTPDEIKEGDLVFFKIDGNSISHVGVYLRNKMFVHSSTSKGVIINSMDEAYYKKFFHSGGRVKNS